MLMPDDFKSSTKIRVDNHLFNKENLPSHYKIKEYCPIVFRKLREIFGIKEQSYLESFTKFQPKVMDNSGKSGAKFYSSFDRRLVIKTLFSEEVMQMHQILKSYHQHVVERNGKTLLTQYLGMYRITVEGSETYFVVMRNMFGHKIKIHKKYDLKGSTVQRSASIKEKNKDIPTFKDNDFVNDGIKIHIGEEGKLKVMETLKYDCEFMVQNNLMDYSLICGIHDMTFDSFVPCTSATQTPSNANTTNEQSFNTPNPPNMNIGRETDPDSENGEIFLSTDEAGSGPDTGPDSNVYYCYSNAGARRDDGGGESNEVEGADIPLGDKIRALIDPAIDVYAIPSGSGSPKQKIYFLAIIDLLTHYGVKKKTAHAAKTVKHGAEADISTVNPEQYAKRFLEFVEKCLD
ncbi:unnamed protein product [Gordionus sp. m RMFG-2023]